MQFISEHAKSCLAKQVNNRRRAIVKGNCDNFNLLYNSVSATNYDNTLKKLIPFMDKCIKENQYDLVDGVKKIDNTKSDSTVDGVEGEISNAKSGVKVTSRDLGNQGELIFRLKFDKSRAASGMIGDLGTNNRYYWKELQSVLNKMNTEAPKGEGVVTIETPSVNDSDSASVSETNVNKDTSNTLGGKTDDYKPTLDADNQEADTERAASAAAPAADKGAEGEAETEAEGEGEAETEAEAPEPAPAPGPEAKPAPDKGGEAEAEAAAKPPKPAPDKGGEAEAEAAAKPPKPAPAPGPEAKPAPEADTERAASAAASAPDKGAEGEAEPAQAAKPAAKPAPTPAAKPAPTPAAERAAAPTPAAERAAAPTPAAEPAQAAKPAAERAAAPTPAAERAPAAKPAAKPAADTDKKTAAKRGVTIQAKRAQSALRRRSKGGGRATKFINRKRSFKKLKKRRLLKSNHGKKLNHSKKIKQ
jgi:hypothetical protein